MSDSTLFGAFVETFQGMCLTLGTIIINNLLHFPTYALKYGPIRLMDSSHQLVLIHLQTSEMWQISTDYSNKPYYPWWSGDQKLSHK